MAKPFKKISSRGAVAIALCFLSLAIAFNSLGLHRSVAAPVAQWLNQPDLPTLAQNSDLDPVVPVGDALKQPIEHTIPLVMQGPPKLGHFPYPQADIKTLVAIGNYGGRVEKLAPEPAAAWQRMVAAAKASGVRIVPISAFRSLETQRMLFESRVRSRGSAQAAARSVAPPGYSEHHTGYAIDLGDGRAPDLDISTSFDRSTAFRWLSQHAKEYGFEISFLPNNHQNVIYEPWHWRFIGSDYALKLFAAARHQA